MSDTASDIERRLVTSYERSREQTALALPPPLPPPLAAAACRRRSLPLDRRLGCRKRSLAHANGTNAAAITRQETRALCIATRARAQVIATVVVVATVAAVAAAVVIVAIAAVAAPNDRNFFQAHASAKNFTQMLISSGGDHRLRALLGA